METNKIEIYNLQFPRNVNELNVGEYRFTRTADYDNKAKELASSYSNCWDCKVNTGSHQITALMTLPQKQKMAVLPWEDPKIHPKKSKEYLDLLLIISLLTKRNVFAKTWNDAEGVRQIVEDPRQHRGEFSHFVFPVHKNINYITKEMINDDEMNELNKIDADNEIDITKPYEWKRFDQGLEIATNKAWETVKNETWKKKYKNGAFLLIFSQAQRMQRRESSFILSWSIWEHIFSLHHSSTTSDIEIMTKSAKEKYEYIKSKYFSDSTEVKNANKNTSKIRDRLIHFGYFPENGNKKQADNINNFFRDTENLVANILGITH